MKNKSKNIICHNYLASLCVKNILIEYLLGFQLILRAKLATSNWQPIALNQNIMNPNTLIREVMTTKLVTINKDEKIKNIKILFEKNNFHHLLVIGHNNNNNELVGIISKEDFYKFTYKLTLQTTGKTWSTIKYDTICAKDIMTKSPFVLDPDDTIGLAADLFLANKFHALPVVEINELVGILTSFDLLKYSFYRL